MLLHLIKLPLKKPLNNLKLLNYKLVQVFINKLKIWRRRRRREKEEKLVVRILMMKLSKHQLSKILLRLSKSMRTKRMKMRKKKKAKKKQKMAKRKVKKNNLIPLRLNHKTKVKKRRKKNSD